MRERENDTLKRGGVEFRYASAALLIACANADLDESAEEQKAVRELLVETFGIPERTIQKLFNFAYDASEDSYLNEITALVDEHFPSEDKRSILNNLWHVALADGRIDEEEETFILRVAAAIGLTAEDVEDAKNTSDN